MSLTREELQDRATSNRDLSPDQFKSTIERAVTASKSGWTAPSVNDQKLARWAQRFPWVLKNRKRKQVCYDWDQGFINETVEPYYAARRYEQNKKYQRDIKEKLFWDDEVFCFYIWELDDDATASTPAPKDITSQFAEYLWLLAANRILKEKNFRVWQTILNGYDLYEIERPNPYINDQFFVPKLNPITWQEKEILSSDPIDTKTLTSPEQLKDKRMLLFLKENEPDLFKMVEEALALPRDARDTETKVKRDSIYDSVMNKFNNRYKKRKTAAQKQLSRENAPLKEAYNFPAIAGMSLTEIQELCAMKDFLMWKIKFRPSILKGKIIEEPYTNTTLTTQKVTLHWSPNFDKPVKLFWHYTSSVRFAMFWEEKYYKRIRPGQTLQPWQWIAKLYTGWVTSVVAPRRGWKSYWWIEEAVEMFTADTQERSKPIRVLFVGINTKKLKTVIKYLLSFTKAFTQAGYFDWEASKNIMHYRKKESNKKATEADDLGTIEFIWSKDEDAWVWDYADLIIIDECERIDENVWEDIMPIITNEWARCILISTLNKNSQKTWFYNQLVQGETEELQRNLMQQDVVTVIREKWNKRVQPTIDKVASIEAETGQPVPFEEWINWIDIDAMAADMRYARQRVWLRFTGEDNDLKTEKEKWFARDRLRWTKAYYPEWRAIFPEDTGVYDYESSIKDATYFQWRKYSFVTVAYDPAESKDKAALVCMWYDNIQNKIELFRIEKLPNNYTYHGPLIKRMLTECADRIDVASLPDWIAPEQRVFFAYDFNWVGQGLEPFFQECGVRIDLKVRFTGQGWITKKGINHNVPKELLVNMLQNTMDHWALVINQDCHEFIEELEHYKSYYNPDTGYTKYQAEHGASDDFVSAAMIGTYFILEYMGEKFNITKNEIEQAVDPDSDMTVDNMFKEVEKIVMQGINNWKTVQQVIDEYNGRSQRNSLKRQDVLSQFWY